MNATSASGFQSAFTCRIFPCASIPYVVATRSLLHRYVASWAPLPVIPLDGIVEFFIIEVIRTCFASAFVRKDAESTCGAGLLPALTASLEAAFICIELESVSYVSHHIVT